MVIGPGASQPPVVTNRPACLPGSQGAHLAPTWSQHPCPMFCPLTGHTEGPHTSEALLQDQLSPYIFCQVPSRYGTGPLSLVSGVAPWTPPGANPFCFQPSRPPATRPTWLARPPSLAHLHHLTFWSPRLALAPHPDTTQDPVLLRGKGHFHRRPPVFSGDLGDLGRRGRESAQEVSRVHSMDRPGGTTL